LQTGHIGRSIVEIELRITLHPLKPYAFQPDFIVRQPTLESKIFGAWVGEMEAPYNRGIAVRYRQYRAAAGSFLSIKFHLRA
jgi:hypothetical protein